jgi:hypothetical protein
MILSLIVIVFWGLLAFVWASRGFYSALLGMICTVLAGAIAFGLWEVVGTKILGASPQAGTFAWLEGAAWALGLALPFIVSLALFRAVTDAVLRANVTVSTTVNYIGGGICGVVTSTIVMGILVLSVGQQRFGQDLFGFKPLTFQAGNVVRDGGLILPVDRITAGMYSHFSKTSLRTRESLAKWHPDFELVGPAMRMTFEGSNRTTARPEQVSLAGRFTARATKLEDLLSDSQNPGRQNVQGLDGQPFPSDSRIEGFVLNVTSGAAEKNGKVTVGNAQVRLVASNGRTSRSLFPIAMASQADATTPGFGRWRFDSNDTFIASVGGGSQAVMSFEFVVPNGFEPLALYFKGSRVAFDPNQKPTVTASSAGMRDAIQAAPVASVGGGGGASINVSDLKLDKARKVETQQEGQAPTGIRIGGMLPFTIQEGLHAPLELTDDRRVVQGEVTFAAKDVDPMQSVDKALRIDSFVLESDTTIVQVEAAGDSTFSFLNPTIATLEKRDVPIALIDDRGQVYQPVGFVYRDDIRATVRYTPGQPIATLSQIDATASISRSKPTQRLTLLFRVTKGAKIQYYVAGQTVIAEFVPTVSTNR